MRVLMTTLAQASHYYSQVPLAWALRAAGHEVRVASQPMLTDDILASGLPAVPVGTDHVLQQMRQDLAMAGNVTFPKMYEERDEPPTWADALDFEMLTTALMLMAANNDTMVDGLVSYARSWRPDLVISEPYTYAGGIAAAACGAAHARLLWGLDAPGSARKVFNELRDRQPEQHREDPVAEWLTWTAARYDVPFGDHLITGHWTIDPLPKSLRLPVDVPTLGMRYIPYNGRSVIPDWLLEPPAKPRVCLTLGLSGRDFMGADPFSPAELVDAMADLDIELVATLSGAQREGLEKVPDNTRIEDFVPLQALLPTCRATIHHGGFGSVGGALINGVPQITIADMWDTPVKGQMIEDQGAGLFFRPERMSAQTVREGVERLLSEPSFADNAARLRAELLAEPTPAALVAELERLTGEHRS
ncbi:glycosyl transferase family 28 [Spongiactinospora rosea]|uniref:Glycosyl transferase family 28 n=1 Tax=Spongiactinospora rosea TaxID=2248750 RepID=A0A366M5H5_9ACTN|nr:activator-dependent family glycosyltransferase [Spongiactinospora rosea]RBQ20844.1 glycosyl transferase family 28 [Spongiactinospora rosea]